MPVIIPDNIIFTNCIITWTCIKKKRRKRMNGRLKVTSSFEIISDKWGQTFRISNKIEIVFGPILNERQKKQYFELSSPADFLSSRWQRCLHCSNRNVMNVWDVNVGVSPETQPEQDPLDPPAPNKENKERRKLNCRIWFGNNTVMKRGHHVDSLWSCR